MRRGQIILLALFMAGGKLLAQQQVTGEASRAGSLDYEVPSGRLMLDFQPAKAESSSLGKHLRLEGPLVAPVKSKKVWDLPRRLLRSINPFAKSSSPGPVEDVGPVDSRAWSTVVGWNKHSSAFLDDTHHEPELRLVTLSVGRQP